MINIKIDIKGLEDGALERLAKRVNNLQPAMFQAGLYMERETKLNFAKQSDPDGAAWAPLAASTLKRKRSGAILRETSTLMGGISLTTATKQQAIVAATAGGEYGIYHQTGTSKMPKREFIGIGEQHVPKIRKIFESYLSK